MELNRGRFIPKDIQRVICCLLWQGVEDV